MCHCIVILLRNYYQVEYLLACLLACSLSGSVLSTEADK